MKTLGTFIAVIVLLGLASPQPVAAQAVGAGGCTIAGSWKGSTGDTSFLATYVETAGASSGTADLDLWGDVTFGGAFPTAVRMTSGRGTWTRAGAWTADYQFLAVGLDAASHVVYQLKVTGRKEMARGCGSQTFTVTIALYGPSQDPFGAASPMVGPFPGENGTATRVPPPSR